MIIIFIYMDNIVCVARVGVDKGIVGSFIRVGLK